MRVTPEQLKRLADLLGEVIPDKDRGNRLSMEDMRKERKPDDAIFRMLILSAADFLMYGN